VAEQIAPRTLELVGQHVVAGPHLATLKHGVTRFRITLHCYEATRNGSATKRAKLFQNAFVRWVALNQLADYPLSTTGRKISRLLTGTNPKSKRG